MTSVATGYSLSQDDVRQLETAKLKPKLLSDEEFARVISRLENMLEQRHTRHPDLSNHPAYQDYATVEVNGKVVATIDNHGFVTSSNRVGASFAGSLPGDVNGRNGPVLAEARAQAIARALGGKVVKSGSALTQTQFERLPRPRAVVDYAALHADPAYQSLMKNQQARSELLAQQIGQKEASDDGFGAAAETQDGSAAVETFLEYMAKTPEERYFESFLKTHGLTQEEFDALPAEEMRALLKEFQEYVRQSVENESAEKVARAVRSELL